MRLMPSAPRRSRARVAPRGAAAATAARSSASIAPRSGAWRRGTTRAWPRVAGLMSMNATVRSSSATIAPGISPATILQNRQSGARSGMAAKPTRRPRCTIFAQICTPISRVAPVMHRSSLEAFSALWRAYGEGRLERSLDLVAEDCEATFIDGTAVLRGHDGIREWLATQRRQWKSITVSYDEVHEERPGCVLGVGR